MLPYKSKREAGFMRKRIVVLCVSACMFITFLGGEMVHAATLNQIMALAQQEKNKDEK